MTELWQRHYGRYFGQCNLNLGCAGNKEPGFVNLDKNPAVNPDVVHDMEVLPLPFADNTFDCVFGSHVFEHIERKHFLPLVAEINRILKPGGCLIGITPYGTNFAAWEAPQHLMLFSEATWMYCIPEIYEGENTAGYRADQGDPLGRWEVMEQTLVPFAEFEDDPEIEFKRKHWNNVIREIHCVLRKREKP